MIDCIEFLEIENFSQGWSDRIIGLANSLFGDNYLDEVSLKHYLKQPHVCTIAVQNDELLGYCFFVFIDKAHTLELLGITEIELSDMASEQQVLGYCHMKSMGVDPKYGGSGLADRLFENCLENTRKLGPIMAFGTAWKVKDFVPMHRIFTDMGFVCYKDIKQPWYYDSDYSCAECGGRCVCDGVIYYQVL